jgi:AhpD family alkylhydroperoxidase
VLTVTAPYRRLAARKDLANVIFLPQQVVRPSGQRPEARGQLAIDPAHLPAAALTALLGVEKLVHQGGLEPGLVHVVKLLASYANRCAYCVDMHSKNARAGGESEQRLYATLVWRETPFFSARERAALAFTEALTRLDGRGLPDAVFAEARHEFNDAEVVSLTLTIIAINMWNRLTAVIHHEPGSYQASAQQRQVAAAR